MWASAVIPTAIVLGRVLVEPDVAPPEVEDAQLLLVKRQNVTIGCTGDGGTGGDAAIDAPSGDGGIADAGVPDGGVPDGGVADGGVADDGGVPDAGACEMIPGDAITMIVQPHVSISADGTRFAVLLVTPARPLVEIKSNVFEQLAYVTAPKTQTNRVEVPDQSLGTRCESIDLGGGGCGGGGSYSDDPPWDPPGISDAGLGDGRVIEETIGPYQFVRAQPTSPQELGGWLDQLGYAYMQDDLDAVAPYITLGYHVVAIRVAADTMSGTLVPIALTWPGSELRVPAALGRGWPYPGALTVYIAADRKYVLPSSTLRYAGFTNAAGTSYLTRNEITIDQNKPVELDPIAVHNDDQPFQEVKVVTEYVHVPVEVPCDEDEGGGCCSECNAKPRARLDYGVLALAVLVVLLRRRR